MKILRHVSFRTVRLLTSGIALTVLSFPGFAQIISTVAGTGGFGNTGDGGSATAAQIGMPASIAFDASGNMYISDANNYVIRKVSSAGIISTIAGTGTMGSSGDGGPATAADISPGALAVDASGNVYFASGSRVRKINTSGIISTYAGGGTWACPGCGPAGDGGPATAAHFASLYGIKLDASGNLYVADQHYQTIRKVNASTGIVSTVAGVYIGAIATHSGNGGPATAAGIGKPTDLAFDPSGNMYITDNDFGAVRRVDPSGIIHAFAGIPVWGSAGGSPSGDGGPATAARLGNIHNITCDGAGNVYIAALSTGAIRKIASSGIITRFAGNGSTGYSGDGGPATAAQISTHNRGLLFDASGNMFFADQATGRVRKISPGSPSAITGALTTCVGGTTTLSCPASGTWSITPTTVATIGSSSGVVTGVTPGTATVTYSLTAGGSATAVVTVVATPPSISGADTICTGTFATYLNTMPGGLWSSSNTALATIGSTTGFAAGISAGVATLTYLGSSSCYATHTITIQATPPAITGSSTVCSGGTATLSNTMTGGLWSATGSTLTVGSATGVVTGVSTGTSTVSYTRSGCSATKSVTVGPSPTAYTVSGTGSGCSSTGIPVTLSNSQTGVSYQLYRGTTAVGGPATGSTGSPILFGAQTVSGTYTVIANPGTSCSRTMTGSAVVTIITTPVPYAVTGGGVYCPFGAAPNIGLSNSQTGVTYRLYRGSTPVGGAVTGTGSAISFGTFTIAGTYTAIANPATACSLAMSGTAVVIASSGPLPAIMTVGGGGPFCSGGPGVPVTLPGSSVGYNYVLYRSGVATGISLPGIGSSLHFGLQTIPGIYTVVAVNSITGCANNMRGGANVTMYPSPDVYTVTGGGAYCSGGVGFPIGLTGSQAGISYRLYNGATLAAGPIWGTGGAISFGNRTTAGTYTVRGSSSYCTSTMSGSATISVIPLPVISGTTFIVAPASTISLTGTPTGGFWTSSTPAVATIGSSSGIVTGVSLGSTVITYTASDCRSTRTVYVTRTGRRDPNSGVTYSKAEISVVPNPNHGAFTVEGTLSTANDEQVTLELNDMLGKTVYVNMFTATDGKISKMVELNNIASGIYLLTVRTPQDKQVFRVMVQ